MSIEEEPNGMLWVSTNNGLYQFSYANNKSTAYTVSEGLKSNQFSLRSSCRWSETGLLFGTINGVELLSVEKMQLNYAQANVYISSINISGEVDKINLPLNGIKNYKLKLKHDKSSFTVAYVSPGFHANGRVKYAYRVAGRSDEWIFVDDNRQVTFSELPPGQYTFNVKAFIEDSDKDLYEASVDILVLPPFWATWWFRICVLIILLVGIYVVYYLRIKNYKKNKRILKQLVKKRTRELETEKERAINYAEKLENRKLRT